MTERKINPPSATKQPSKRENQSKIATRNLMTPNHSTTQNCPATPPLCRGLTRLVTRASCSSHHRESNLVESGKLDILR